jgi:hypothetical protein
VDSHIGVLSKAHHKWRAQMGSLSFFKFRNGTGAAAGTDNNSNDIDASSMRRLAPKESEYPVFFVHVDYDNGNA